MKIAVVFPGQGSQNKSMLDSFEEIEVLYDIKRNIMQINEKKTKIIS